MSNKIHLSVVVPAYNEQNRLPKTLREIEKYLKTQSYDWEIVVVNDGSKDNTSQVVKELLSEIENLRLVDNKENHGKGYVVRQGMLEAKGKYRVFTDADNSTSIDQVEKMWPEFEKGYDIIIGSRDIKGAVLSVPQTWLRRRIGDIFNLLVQITCGLWGIWDTQCGFKGFTEKAAEDIFPKCRIDRFAFDPEILVIAKKMGYKIKEIPVTWINDPESKVKLKSMIKMAVDLLKIRKNLIIKKYD
ncbi:MAG: dolichyl-phosphate beta-glucosyltransferase [Candidatus Nealsonbacteria bacterium]